MFSKTIFKQTFKANYKLWLIFTIILCAISSMTIAVFDPSTVGNMMDAMKDAPMAGMMSQMSNMGSILGMLSSNFHGMIAIILPLIYIIITANDLIASKVDKGSMAYLLSTPLKRSTISRTQALYLITAILAMFLTISAVGLTTVQITQGSVFGEAYTSDVKAVSDVLDMDKQEIADNLSLVLGNDEAIKAGASARKIDNDVYIAYVNMKTADDSASSNNEIASSDKQMEEMQAQMTKGFTSASEVLNLDVSEVTGDLKLIKDNPKALNAAVEASGIPQEVFVGMINAQLASNEISSDEGMQFDTSGYLMLNLGCFLLMFALSSISFMFSCIFNLSKNSLAFGAGIPVAFFIFQIISQIGDTMKNFKYLSLNTLYNTDSIINGSGYGMQFIALAVTGIVLYCIGITAFKRKDLPL